MADDNSGPRTIPVTEDVLVVGRRTVDVGTVRVSKTTETRQAIVDEPVITEELQIERRRLTEDSKSSWLDWAQLQLLPVVTPTPHALGGRWSWAGGANGPGNLLRYGTWSDGRRVF